MLVVQRIGTLLALAILLGPAIGRAQTASATPAMPEPVLFSDWPTDKPYYTRENHRVLTVIRKYSVDSRDSYVAYGVDVGHKQVLFQIVMTGLDQLAQFNVKLIANDLRLEQEAAADDPHADVISNDIGRPIPPPMPGGPIGLPYGTILGNRLISFGQSVYETQNLFLNTPIPVYTADRQ